MVTFTGSSGASLEITDLFSDYTGSEVTIRASQDHQVKAVFQLLDGTNLVESQEVLFNQ